MNIKMETPKITNESFVTSPEQIKENINKLKEVRDSILRHPAMSNDVADLNKTIVSLEDRLKGMQN